MTGVLGIDVSKDKLAVTLLRDDAPAEHSEFDNTKQGCNALWRYVKKRGGKQLHACLEATGLYYELVADFLHAKGMTVSVVNPARIKAYADSQLARNKTDKLDAALIADFCRTQQPPAWTPPDPSWRELRALARHLDDLQSDLQRQRNRLHARQHAAQEVPTVVDNLQQQIVLLNAQIAQIKQAMNDHIDQHPDLKRDRDLIASITGIGTLTAGKLLSEFRDLSLFDNVRQVVAFAGLNPRQRQSGTSVRGKAHISKMGRASIRATLYMPAIVAKNHNPLLKAFAARLAAQGKCELEIVVAVMRKLLHLVYGVLKSGQPFDPQYLDKVAAFA